MQTEVFCSECGFPLTIDGEKDEQTSLYNLYVCPCEVCARKQRAAQHRVQLTAFGVSLLVGLASIGYILFMVVR